MNGTPIRLFDTHCHLQDPRLLASLDDVMRRAEDAGVFRFLCCGTAEDDWAAVLNLARRFPGVTPALGLHPIYVRNRGPDWAVRLRSLLESTRAAVGEIGLDQTVEPRNDGEQEDVLHEQLKLAAALNRPVSIHCRQAWGRLPELLLSVTLPGAGVAIHSYSGGVERVRMLTDAGIYLSFSGSLTRPNNRRGRAAVTEVPWERLLVETDAPDIMPMLDDEWPKRGAVNEPANLPIVVKQIAELRGVAPEEVAERTLANAERLYGALGATP